MSTPTDPENLPADPEPFDYPFGPVHKTIHDLLWKAVHALQAPRNTEVVRDTLEVRGENATVVLSPEDQDGAYSALALSRHMSGAVSLDLVEYNEDHSHAVSTSLFQANLSSRRAFLGTLSAPLNRDDVPVVTGVVSDPNSEPANAAVLERVLEVLEQSGMLKRG